MPGRVHVHHVGGKRLLVYHRAGSPLKIHGVEHAKFKMIRDVKVRAGEKRSAPHGYPHTGDVKVHKSLKGRI